MSEAGGSVTPPVRAQKPAPGWWETVQDGRFALQWLAKVAPLRLAAPKLAAHVEDDPGKENAPISVLCLTRHHFLRDIEQLRKRTALRWLKLRSPLHNAVMATWVPESLRRQSWYAGDRSPEAEAVWNRAAAFDAAFLKALRKRVPVDAVMAANTDYWQDEGMRRACLALGIPFLVLSREHFLTQKSVRDRIRKYAEPNYKFSGAGVALFGEASVCTLVDSGACPPEKIRVTGAPRLDAWRDEAAGERDTITLFSFARERYLAQAASTEVLLAFARASLRWTDGLRWVVKCKNQSDKNNVTRLVAQVPGHQLRIVMGADVPGLMRRSRLVVGFNSLVVIETLLSPARLCIPSWGDALRDPSETNLDPQDPELRAVIDFVPDLATLERELERAATADVPAGDGARRRAALRRYFHFPEDTTCSAEVERWVRDVVRPGE